MPGKHVGSKGSRGFESRLLRYMHVFWLATLATHLVTGNGFGFAVVSPDSSTITKFYAHPYSFACGPAHYEQDSHVIRVRCGAKTGTVFIRDGTLHGTLEDGVKNDIDGALLALIHLGVVTDTAIIESTVQRMELLKVASGGYRRVRSTYTDPAIFEYWYERQEFVFVDFSLAEVERRLGRRAEAKAMIQRIVDKAAADNDIIPEMYVALPCTLFPGTIGDPTGARPMVGYGAGAYILDVLDRQ
jgi:hypothetical protein